MSTATLSTNIRTNDSLDALEYRAIHTGAIAGLLLGVLSVATVVPAATNFEACLMIAPIPLLGIFVSLRSLAAIRRQPETYTGTTMAATGAFLSALFLVTGVGYGGYVYATEVPDGYERTSFTSMKPDTVEERGNIYIPPDIAALAGQQVFIKGYVRPGSHRTISDEFLLVRDNNECCFGEIDKVKYYDQIQVKLTAKQTASFDLRLYRVGGRLMINPANLGRGPEFPVYLLVADYLK
ncbi:MAG: hypothetical protein WD851_23490 [Pirellulales bacterium]